MMENETETTKEQDSAQPAASLGRMLREAREQLGLSVLDVSSQIKFAPRQIEALEADDFKHLPEMAFLRGFVRSYAKILHLDAQVLLAALPQDKAAPSELVPGAVKELSPDIHALLRHNQSWLVAALLLLMVAAGFSLWHFSAPPEEAKAAKAETPVSTSTEPVVKPDQPASGVAVTDYPLPKAQTPAALAQSSVPAVNAAPSRPAKKMQTAASAVQPEKQKQTDKTPLAQPDGETPITSLRLEFSEDAWAEIKDKDGKILSSRTHTGGSELKVNGRAPFSLLIGHAKSVRLYYKGKEVDLAPHTRRSNEVASLTLE